MNKRRKEFAIASLFVAASAGSYWALRTIREHGNHLQEETQDKETRMYLDEVRERDEKLTARQNLQVRAAGVRGFVNRLLEPSDPHKAAGMLEAASSLTPEDARSVVQRLFKFPYVEVPQRFLSELEVQTSDIGYIFEQYYREKLLRNGYQAEALTEVSGLHDWRQVGNTIASQWRFPRLAGDRHGFDPNEHRFLDRFSPHYLKKGEDGKPEVQFLVVKKKKDVVGYVAFMVTSADVFSGKDLGRVTLADIQARVNPTSGEKVMVYLSATPARGHDLGEVVATGMFAGSDYAKQIGVTDIFLPGLSPYAAIEQKRSGESYETIVNRRDEAGCLRDKWRERLTLFATSVVYDDGKVVVNPRFMEGKINAYEMAELLDERERRLTNGGENMEPLLHHGLIYVKNSPHVPFKENHQGEFEYQVPAFWMKMKSYPTNVSLGSMSEILG